MHSPRGAFPIRLLSPRQGCAVLVVSWILEREYRQHRVLDDELPTTYSNWLASLDRQLQRDDTKPERIVKVVVHPAEIETWARREGRQVNEQARSDYAALMWRTADARRRAGRDKAATGAVGCPIPERSGIGGHAGRMNAREPNSLL